MNVETAIWVLFLLPVGVFFWGAAIFGLLTLYDAWKLTRG